jgi:3-phenylpropionate/trans-cinnamate dioxygenase ferredoxin reductase component
MLVERRYVVVGASLAGVAAVEAIRSLDDGGRIQLVGSEPHLPYDRPPLSKEFLQRRRGPDDLRLRDQAWYDERHVELILGEAAQRLSTRSGHLELEGGRCLPFDRLVIATGASPRCIPTLRGLDGVHVLRSLDDALGLRSTLDPGARLAVIGGGFIGLEVAASARQLGAQVTVLEALSNVLRPALGEQIGQAIAQLHREHGVDIRTNTTVEGPVTDDGRVTGLRLTGGDVVEADAVLVGIGVAPSTSWIGDEAIAVEDGVLVDPTLETSVPGVFAAGDVARVSEVGELSTYRSEHWASAVEQGRTAGRNSVREVGDREQLATVPTFWSDQYDAKIRCAGTIPDPDDVEVIYAETEPLRLVALAVRDRDVLAGVITIGKPSAVARCRAFIGVPGGARQARALFGA